MAATMVSPEGAQGMKTQAAGLRYSELHIKAVISLSPDSCIFPYPSERKVKEREVAQSCLTLCNPVDCSMPGFPVRHQLLELTQTHVHRVGDAIQPFHSLSSPSPPTFNLFHHQGLFQSAGS